MSLVKICISFLTCRVERVNSVQEILKQVDLLHYYPILVEHEIDMAALRQERDRVDGQGYRTCRHCLYFRTAGWYITVDSYLRLLN